MLLDNLSGPRNKEEKSKPEVGTGGLDKTFGIV